ncbi:MAG: hypothetical protein CFE24_14935 [Flavobacterium sp. BFFFF2]|nr:MAG: hypothetical protein CFE24_14935 [Flavobacterium sp. BFFFF2]
MKNHKFQQIRVRVTEPGQSLRIVAETDKQYNRIRGIYISMPLESLMVGTMLGLKVNNQEVFDDNHEVKLISCGIQVAPNQKFFLFEEHLDGGGSAIEGKFTDGGTIAVSQLGGDLDPNNPFPYEARIYLWLTNEKQEAQ